MQHENKGRTLKTTRTSLRILELVLEYDGLTLAELDQLIDKPKSTLHSHLHTLIDCRYLVRDGDIFTVSFRLSLLGKVVVNRYPNYDLIRGTVENLAEETGEEANFTVLEHKRLLWAYGSSGDTTSMERNMNVRTDYHLHDTAAGRAILADMDRSCAERILDKGEIPYEFEDSIVDRQRLLDSLDTIAEQGYGVFDEKSASGLVAVGAPVHRDGAIIGGLSVGGPKYRIGTHRLHGELADTLLDMVARLESDF